MKQLLIIFLIKIFVPVTIKEIKIKGKYKMEYEQKYSSQNCTIIFDEDQYLKKLPNGKSIKGNIEYRKFNVILKDENSNLQMGFAKNEIKKDTIYFGTKDLSEKSAGMKITINEGKLIKLK